MEIPSPAPSCEGNSVSHAEGAGRGADIFCTIRRGGRSFHGSWETPDAVASDSVIMRAMKHRCALPPSLGKHFSLADATAAGVGIKRCDAADLHRPFPGVRSLAPPTTFRQLVDCYAPRLKPGQRFGGLTAARLWGLPLADFWTDEEALDVVVPSRGTAPNTPGVTGRRLHDDRAITWTIAGIPVVDAISAVFLCARSLTLDAAVTMLDALITTATNYPGLTPRTPYSLDEIERQLNRWGRFPGCATIRAALPLARELVESPKETETRLAIINAGMPEPVVQHEVREHGRLIARIDLAYPELKIAIEYEGDGHRTSKKQWRIDIQRQRELEARGWIVLRLTELDLLNGADAFLARVRAARAARTVR